MFGCCVAGRLLQTNLIQVDETHAYFELANAGAINHVCIFLLGDVALPDGVGCAVHFFWPGKGFQLLGMLSNEKPSAIFRLRGTFSTSSASAAQDRFSALAPDNQQPQDVTAILGLSVESIVQIQSQLSSLQGSLVPSQPDLTKDPAAFAERIVKHLLNYISGFTGGAVNPDINVPLSLIAKWYDIFLGKVRATGIGFLERSE